MSTPYLHSMRSQHIINMTKEGQTPRNISEELHVSYQIVCGTIKKARDAGMLPPRKTSSPLTHGSPFYMKRGSIRYIVNELTEEQRQWLVKEADKYGCDTMSEMIVEIIRDAHEAREEP